MTLYTTPKPYSEYYRQSAGLLVKNAKDQLFLAKRQDHSLPEFDSLPINQQGWQFPQGGIDSKEAPHEAALRELYEEIGTKNVRLISISENWYTYDLPKEISSKLWGGRFKGQTQKWFLFEFLGLDEEINLKTYHQEFSTWKWATPQEALDKIVPFKVEVYKAILTEFGFLKAL